MATAISNALGTQRQFTPQPDAVYQGRYNEVQATTSHAGQSSWLSLGESMAKLSQALQGYAVSHEKYLNTKGEIDANAMINSESPEDIMKLNTIDAAQLYGFVDASANPYFKAHAEKIRGNFLSARMKQDYDAKYALTPAKSADEEAKRFAEYASDWRKDNLGNVEPSNQYAFDKGFNESALTNIGQLTANWTKRKNEDDVRNVMANTQSQLGDVIKNAPEILKTNGAMTEQVQAIFNEPRLMGLPAQYRQKLLEDFCTDLTSRGYLDTTRLEQMMDRVVIESNIDGSTTKASDLLDMAAYKEIAFKQNSQFHTKEKNQWMDSMIKMGKKGKDVALAQIAEWRITDPEKAREYNSLYPYINQKIDYNANEAKAANRSRGTKQRGATQGSTSNNITDPSVCNELIRAYMNGQSFFDHSPISSVKVDDDAMTHAIMNQLQYMSDNNYTSGLPKLLSMPQARKVKESLSNTFEMALSGLKRSDDGGVNASPEDAKNILKIMQMLNDSPYGAETILGKDTVQKCRMLRTLTNIGGSSTGIGRFADWLNTGDDMKKEYRQSVESQYANTWKTNDRLEGLQHLGDGRPTYIDFQGGNLNNEIREDVIDMAVAYACAGVSIGQAIKMAEKDMCKSYVEYHYGAFPRGLVWGVSVGANEEQKEQAFEKGLEFYCFQVAQIANDKGFGRSGVPQSEWTHYAPEVQVSWKKDLGIFAFVHPDIEDAYMTASVEDVCAVANQRWQPS